MQMLPKYFMQHFLSLLCAIKVAIVTLVILILTTKGSCSGNIYYEWAAAYTYGGNFQGVEGHIYTWHADVEPHEFSLNMVACGVSKGNQLGEVTSVIQAGWAVHPALFKDGKSRTFVAWTNTTTLCFAQDCPTFVPVSNNTFLGAPLAESVFGDPSKQYNMSVVIYKDPGLEKWWIAFDNEVVGYYPVSLVGFEECNMVVWGGNVKRIGENPTRTQMGNGHFTNEGLTKSGLITNARVKIPGGLPVVVPPTGVLITRPQCYDFKNYGTGQDDKHPGYAYSYGGPGAMSSYCK